MSFLKIELAWEDKRALDGSMHLIKPNIQQDANTGLTLNLMMNV